MTSSQHGQMEPDDGCSSLRGSRTGSKGNRQQYGVPEIVRGFYTITLAFSFHLFLHSWCGEDYPFVRAVHVMKQADILTLHTSSSVVDCLQDKFKGENVAITCIYFNYKEQTTQTISELVASLLKQLVQDCPETSDHIKKFYKDHHEARKFRPKLADLIKALKSEIGTYSRVFIVVDALDECLDSAREHFIKEFQSLARNVNLMVTARPLPSIEHHFQGVSRLEIRAHSDDMRKYIEDRIPREGRLARLVNNDRALQESIVIEVVARASGMYVFLILAVPLGCLLLVVDLLHRFLLAKLHMDSLVSKSSLRAVRNALKVLPTRVNDTYDEVMARIRAQSPDDRELAENVLSWIAYARRPISLQELQHAVAVTPDMLDMDPEALVDKFILIDVCAGLVVIDDRSSIIQLVRKSPFGCDTAPCAYL